ncbi:hypothetical protein [Nocardia sp. NPDC057440]|uniref:hypothetical protein n=1 Tax=Nocardia sp. NPDC057440 TaxID=3346134 RepID=UPI0036714D3A
MTIQRRPSNIAREFVRRAVPKKQPQTPKPNPDGFPEPVKHIIRARSGGICELDSCGVAQVIHHRRPRGVGGTSLGWVNHAANALHLADACHLRIELHRTEAYCNGWLVSQLGDKQSADVPVLYRGRWVLLDDRGGITPIEGGVA